MAGARTSGDYVPTDVDSAVPAGPEARRRRSQELEDIETRREILLGRIARLQAALYAAQGASDGARVTELQARIAVLAAERDAL